METLILQDYLRCGGTEKHAVFLTQHFNQEGHPTRLLTFRPEGPLASQGIEPFLDSLQKRDLRLDWFAPGLYQKVKSLKPKTVLCMGTVANSYGSFIQKKFPDINLITTLRTGKKLSPLYRRSLYVSKRIIVNSQWWKSALTLKGIAPNKIDLIYNPLLLNVQNACWGKLRESARQARNISDECVIFLGVQGFRPGKHQARLIKAFSLLGSIPGWELWLVGEGQQRQYCEKLAKSLGLGHKIHFFGLQKDTLPYYAAADVAISSSSEDSLPNFLIEAQASGLPVIALDTKGVRETFLPGESGILLENASEALLTEKILFLFNNRKKRIQMGQIGRIHALKTFSTDQQAESTLNLIKQT